MGGAWLRQGRGRVQGRGSRGGAGSPETRRATVLADLRHLSHTCGLPRSSADVALPATRDSWSAGHGLPGVRRSGKSLRAASRCGGHPLSRTVPAVWHQATPGLWEAGAGRCPAPRGEPRAGVWSRVSGESLYSQWCEVFMTCKFCFRNGGTKYHVLFQWPFVIYSQPKQFFSDSHPGLSFFIIAFYNHLLPFKLLVNKLRRTFSAS